MDEKTKRLLEDAKECLKAMYSGRSVHGWSTLSMDLLGAVRQFEPEFNPVAVAQEDSKITKETPTWLELKRALVFLFGIVPGMAISAVGFVAGFSCKMFVWGFYRGAKLLEVFDRRPGELYGDFNEALNEALVERNVQGVQTEVQRPVGPQERALFPLSPSGKHEGADQSRDPVSHGGRPL